MATYRSVDIKLEFKWGGGDWANESGWTDETTNLLSASGALEIIPPAEAFVGGRQIIQQMTLVMANPGLRYSPYNASGPLYVNIGSGGSYLNPVRLSANIDSGGWERVFVGFVKLPEENYAGNRITFQCWDLGERLREKKSTSMLHKKTVSGVRRLYQEHEIVQIYLELLGLTDGTHFSSPDQGTPTIDYSTLSLDYSWLDDESVWEEIVSITQATGSRVYIDREGQVRYEKDYNWSLPYSYTPETITLDKMSDLTPIYSDKGFYDEIVAEFATRNPDSEFTELWKLPRPLIVEAGKTEEVTARFNTPATVVNTPVADTDYFVRAVSGGAAGSYTITVTPYAQQAKVTVVNNSSDPIAVMNFRLTGQALVGSPSDQVKKEADSAQYGRRLEIRSNPYLQTKLQAQAIVDYMAWWYDVAKLSFKVNGLSGDPTRDIGTRIRVQAHNEGTAVFDKTGIIVKNEWQVNILPSRAISYVQSLTLLEDVFQPSPGYFVLGDSSSLIGGTKELFH